jgi:pimeloyl-ACP methyl ester carboxylesterase
VYVFWVTTQDLRSNRDRRCYAGSRSRALKSLSSFATAAAAAYDLPGIWPTPLLRRPSVVAALRACTAPQLLIGGTADVDAWDGEVARSLSADILEIPDADHGMWVPGPLARSAAVLGSIATAIEAFALKLTS